MTDELSDAITGSKDIQNRRQKVIVFQISIWGDWSFVWGLSPPKPPVATGLKISVSSYPIYRTNTGALVENEKVFLKHDVPQHRKDRNSSRKCTTNPIRCQNHNAEVIERIWLCLPPSQTCVHCFTFRLMCTDTSKKKFPY